MAHVPVLLHEAVAALNIKADGYYIDGTFGRGGHAKAILKHLDVRGRLLIIDKDTAAIAVADKEFNTDTRVVIQHGSYAQMETLVKQQEWLGKVNGILLDLGVSSAQLDSAERGFSFLKDGPLDMRMDTTQGQTAAEWINSATETEIADVLYHFGEEKFSRRMAKAIVKARELQPILTTARLADIVAKAHPAWQRDKHPATRAFQAIRIFINSELDDLKSCLQQVLTLLAVGGRLVIISFHSLEDRLVKRFIQEKSRGDEWPIDLPIQQQRIKASLRPIGKALRANEEEKKINYRARSAVMRVAEKIA